MILRLYAASLFSQGIGWGVVISDGNWRIVAVAGIISAILLESAWQTQRRLDRGGGVAS